MIEKEIIKLLRAIHLALHSLEEGGIKEEAELSDNLNIKFKNENKK